MFKNTLQEPQIFLRVFYLLAVEADDGLQGFDRLCVRSAAEIAQRDNVEQAALDARQEPAVVHGFQHIAEQEIDQQIFGLRGKAHVEIVRRLRVVHAVQQARELRCQVLHIAQHHPGWEKRTVRQNPPPHESQRPRGPRVGAERVDA